MATIGGGSVVRTPDALRDAFDESKAVGDLVLALRVAGAREILPPLCAEFGREITSMQCRGCSPCFVRPETCASCGARRKTTYRDRNGWPRWSQCSDIRELVSILTNGFVY